MSGHPDLRPFLEGREIAADERAGLLAHLESCSDCRARVAAADPSLLFSMLAREPIPAGVLERVSEGVREATAPRRASRRLAFGTLAASVLLAGALGAYLWMGGVPEAVAPAPSPAAQRLVAQPATEPAVPAGMIEVLESPGEREVLEISVGETRLVMIFDEAMDI